ncbi:D-alanyl-D-alanine carboxypeptidase family protein [Patescibacteria group bacterium]
MFPLILAITLYAAFSPVQPALPVGGLPGDGYRSFLPLAATAAEPAVDSAAPVKDDPLRIGLELESESAVVLDWSTGKALYAKAADMPRPVASVTKLLTALVVLDAGVPLDDTVEIASSDARPGGIPYVVPGERIRVVDLLHSSLIASANGATVALSRSVGLTPEGFADRMNSLAREIGLRSASFVEPTGLDPDNVASARDVALLVRHALQNDLVAEIVLKRDYEFQAETGLHHRIGSTDSLLSGHISEPPFGFLGGKTGFLQEAGYCFGAAAHDGDGNRIIAVALGAPSKRARFDEVSALMYWTFDAYTWPK